MFKRSSFTFFNLPCYEQFCPKATQGTKVEAPDFSELCWLFLLLSTSLSPEGTEEVGKVWGRAGILSCNSPEPGFGAGEHTLDGLLFVELELFHLEWRLPVCAGSAGRRGDVQNPDYCLRAQTHQGEGPTRASAGDCKLCSGKSRAI